jgi:hypothetical protein
MVVLAVSVGAIAWLWMRLNTHNAWRVLALALIFIGLVYGIRSAWLANFRNGDVPVEDVSRVHGASLIEVANKHVNNIETKRHTRPACDKHGHCEIVGTFMAAGIAIV